jgi:hypothetical protein
MPEARAARLYGIIEIVEVMQHGIEYLVVC